jgi:uncharacterized protein (TIGR03435 family)
MLAAAPAAAGDGGTVPPGESDVGPMLAQALQEQLGLHLEMKKGPVQFIVVDHMEKTPTDN